MGALEMFKSKEASVIFGIAVFNSGRCFAHMLPHTFGL